MLSNKQRIYNFLNGQLMYIEEDNYTTEEEKNKYRSIINRLKKLTEEYQESEEIIDVEKLIKELESKIKETNELFLKKIYNILKGAIINTTITPIEEPVTINQFIKIIAYLNDNLVTTSSNSKIKAKKLSKVSSKR